MGLNKDQRTSTDDLLDEATALNLSRDQLGRLRYAASIHRGTKGQRARAREIAAGIRREIMATVDETVALERLRGGEVRDFNTAGAKRLCARDGLLSLFQSGHLDADQTGAGLAYRRAMEAKGALGASSPFRLGGAASIDRVMDGWLARCRLGVLAAQVDRDVAVELRHRPECLDTLRRVAGYGQAVRSLAPGGKQFEHRVESLILALEIAGRHRIIDPT